MLDLWKIHLLLLTHNFEWMGRLFFGYMLIFCLKIILQVYIPIPWTCHWVHSGHASSWKGLSAHIVVDIIMLAAISFMSVSSLINPREPGVHEKGTLAFFKLMVSDGNLRLRKFLQLLLRALQDCCFVCKLITLQAWGYWLSYSWVMIDY